ncbi:hypothetical protein QAD02_008373 [Eretmocerus hayati]|uniref:Uncharacterized protein n=1 Tax=Eretmocerus hayati TaxID=131215 RepID=A0ACC2N6K1_9HYME|nr:hypothetical protein QAD02_008373 [Eretmocerus hayati]
MEENPHPQNMFTICRKCLIHWQICIKSQNHFFDICGDQREIRTIVFCNAQERLSRVDEARGFTSDVHVEAMMDGDQGFLKLCVNVFPKDNTSMGDDGIDTLESSGNDPGLDKHNRVRFNEVQEIFIPAIVPSLKETHCNM